MSLTLVLLFANTLALSDLTRTHTYKHMEVLSRVCLCAWPCCLRVWSHAMKRHVGRPLSTSGWKDHWVRRLKDRKWILTWGTYCVFLKMNNKQKGMWVKLCRSKVYYQCSRHEALYHQQIQSNITFRLWSVVALSALLMVCCSEDCEKLKIQNYISHRCTVAGT